MTITTRRARMFAYFDQNPNMLHTASYDDTISNDEAQMILSGDFDGFNDSIYERIMDWELDGYLWDYWEGNFARAFGYDAWDEMPERVQELARENRQLNTDGFTRDMIRHWRGNITVTILKPGAKAPENLIYGPGGDCEGGDRRFARYLVDAFGMDVKATSGTLLQRVAQDLELVYGGYDMEYLILTGRVDLMAIYESGKPPVKVKIGPEDADHLLFYDFHNGCGNMGKMHLTRTRTMPAEFRIDGTHGYAVDSCYGFTRQYWQHDIRVA